MALFNKKKRYDYLLVGAGLFNAIFANEASRDGKRCLVVEKRSHIGGNLYCKEVENIKVHAYGPHIFHTSNKNVWEYMNSIISFNNFVLSPIANYKGEIYNLPFNMNTFYQLWRTCTPNEAIAKIKSQRIPIDQPSNLEEQALSVVGEDIYRKLIKGYTEKQWGKSCKELPAFIISRLPLRFIYNNNYFNDHYQGIPIGGYNPIFDKCFATTDVILDTDFLLRKELANKADVVIYTGQIDRYYDYCYGSLEYRSLHFETEVLEMENFQGNAMVNYTDKETPYTRIIEAKHFEHGNHSKTVITKEYPFAWKKEYEPFYPINTNENNERYRRYKQIGLSDKKTYFAGRLGEYKYYNMDEIVFEAIKLYNNIKLLTI